MGRVIVKVLLLYFVVLNLVPVTLNLLGKYGDVFLSKL